MCAAKKYNSGEHLSAVSFIYTLQRSECAIKITRKFIAGEMNATMLPATVVISMRERESGCVGILSRDVATRARYPARGSTICRSCQPSADAFPSRAGRLPESGGKQFPQAQAYRRSRDIVTAFAAGDNVIRAEALSAWEQRGGKTSSLVTWSAQRDALRFLAESAPLIVADKNRRN